MEELIKQLQALDCNFSLTWQHSSKLWYVRIPWYDLASHSKDPLDAMRTALQMIKDNPPSWEMHEPKDTKPSEGETDDSTS